LKLLAGEREPETGRRIEGKTVHLAHLKQELDDLPADLRVLQAVERVAARVQLGKHELSASQLAEKLGFPPKRQWTPVGDLSGGERRRLQLVRLLMAEPNVLLLDEPTNDLDIDTLQQLEDLLDGWPGTLIVVSHDRYLTERVCDTVVALFGDGGITDLPGGIDEYLQRRQSIASARPAAEPAGRPATGERAEAASSGTAEATKLSNAEWRAITKELGKLHRKLDTLAEKESTLHAELAEAATEPDRLV